MTQDLLWNSIKLTKKELTIAKVLRCGQAFRWRFIDGIWSCTIRNRILLFRQDEESLHYSSIPYLKDTEDVVRDYFNLDVKLTTLYEEWSTRDKLFISNSTNFEGVRILRQDPWENLISFICSTNNNVKRISKMCETLCVKYGDHLADFQNDAYYTFPQPHRLSKPEIEQELRELGFGYRAKFIQQTAEMLNDNKELFSTLTYKLRELPHNECHNFLLQFKGVGPKVADCVSLMSLDKHDVVPVDTHVYQIALRDYKFSGGKSGKSGNLNKELYNKIQTFFKDLWGEYAGWAHSVLFAADLRDLNNGINDINASISGTSIKTTESKKRKVEFKHEIKVEENEENKEIEMTPEQIKRHLRLQKRLMKAKVTTSYKKIKKE